MSVGYDLGPWSNFFVAEVGASAALVGLLFVAVSINLARIIGLPGLPERAFEALVVLVMVLLVGTVALVPGQSLDAVAIEILLVAAGCWATTVSIQWKTPKQAGTPRIWMLSRVIPTQIATLSVMASGVSLALRQGGGLYWAVLGIVAAFLAALIDAWVLLVEIQR